MKTKNLNTIRYHLVGWMRNLPIVSFIPNEDSTHAFQLVGSLRKTDIESHLWMSKNLNTIRYHLVGWMRNLHIVSFIPNEDSRHASIMSGWQLEHNSIRLASMGTI